MRMMERMRGFIAAWNGWSLRQVCDRRCLFADRRFSAAPSLTRPSRSRPLLPGNDIEGSALGSTSFRVLAARTPEGVRYLPFLGTRRWPWSHPLPPYWGLPMPIRATADSRKQLPPSLPLRNLATARKHWVLLGLPGLLLVAACGDSPMTPDPSSDRPTAATSMTGDGLPVVQPREFGPPGPVYTIRDEFAAMAGRVPGGFGGLFLDGDGVLTVVLVDGGRSEEARAALAGERLIEARRAGPGGARFDPAKARIRVGDFSYSSLYDWYELLRSSLPVTPATGTIDVRRNRIVLGIPNLGRKAEVEGALADAGIPREAVIIERDDGAALLSSVTDEHRPVPAGIRTGYGTEDDDISDCTIGPNVLRHSSPQQIGFLVNSHCTEVFGEVYLGDPTHYWQPDYTGGTDLHIGNEAIDSAVLNCPENPEYGCRHSDAALGLYNDDTNYELGKIARPASRNQGGLQLDSSTPRFDITQEVGMLPIAGDVSGQGRDGVRLDRRRGAGWMCGRSPHSERRGCGPNPLVRDPGSVSRYHTGHHSGRGRG